MTNICISSSFIAVKRVSVIFVRNNLHMSLMLDKIFIVKVQYRKSVLITLVDRDGD